MKKTLSHFLTFMFGILMVWNLYAADVSKDTIIPYPSGVAPSGEVLDGQWYLDFVLEFTRDTVFALLALIAIGMFLYIWGRLVVARWNPEEFKKAMLSFVYAAVGIVVVAFAWAIVKLVAGIDL